ncbi:MAG: hypothetical protein OEL66_04345 [Desulfobulbaceae bacterium]|nr:hypothetical protein [Desulfobulbaceae bacterium]
MRQIVIDDLTGEECSNIDSYLKRTVKSTGIDGMYWLQLADDLHGEAQQGHQACGPFYFALELNKSPGRETLSCELLVRSESNLHCSCISYATPMQRDFLLRFLDQMLAEEQIRA